MAGKKKNKIDVSLIVTSFIVSALVLFSSILVHPTLEAENWLENAVFVGLICALTALASFGSVHLFNLFRIRRKTSLPPFLSLATLLVILAIFVFGAVGQVIYSLSLRISKEKTGEESVSEPVVTTEGVDLVLLMDNSGSMALINQVVCEACNEVIDRLPQSFRVGGGTFADDVLFTELHDLDTQGKKAIKKSLITDTSLGGGSSFDKALKRARNEFEKNSSDDRNRVLIMFTDGQAVLFESLCGDIARDLRDLGVTVYSIRPDGYFAEDEFIDFVTEDGKHKDRDYVIPFDEDVPDLDEIVDVLNQISSKEASVEKTVPVYKTNADASFTEGTVLYDPVNPLNLQRGITRAVLLILLVLAMQFLFFRGISVSSLLLGILFAAITFGLFFVGGNYKIPIINALAAALFVFTLFSVSSPEDEFDQNNFTGFSPYQ